MHKPVDPRAERILELADARGVSARHVARARELHEAVAEVKGEPLTMNVAMPIAAVLLDLGYSPGAVESVPILARTASLLAHLAEEREHPIGFRLARAAEEADPETGVDGRRALPRADRVPARALGLLPEKLAGHEPGSSRR